MKDCTKYKGRLRDLCEGRGRNGRPNPSQRAIDSFSLKEHIMPATAEEAPAVVKKPDVSSIGTTLSKMFKDEVGALPCGDCKQRIARLNQMTVAEVQAERESLVKQISSSAARNAPSWFTKLLVVVDQSIGTGFTEAFIGNCLDRACGIESSLSPKPVPPRVTPNRTFMRPESDWCVVITTAPRNGDYTLEECVDSIRDAGWSSPIIFAEPGSPVPYDVRVIQNEVRRGCFHNWLYSARWALENSDAEIILCVQDDALFHPNSRYFFEKHCMWPTEDTAFVSFYTPSHYSELHRKGKKVGDRDTGINYVKTSCLWGTVAVAWKRDVLQAVVDHETTKNWCGLTLKQSDQDKASAAYRSKRVSDHYQMKKDNPHLVNNSDYLAGAVVNKLRKKMFFIDPSPVQHVARNSTIGHGGNDGRRNCGRCADHSAELESQVFPVSQIKTASKASRLFDNSGRVVPIGDRVVIEVGNAVADSPPLTIIVRTSFSDPELSRYRWNITQKTLLKSLESQHDKNFTVELICDKSDVLQSEKLAAFIAVVPTVIAENTWYNAPYDGHWRRVARIDDDDIVSVKFVELINRTAFDGTECLLNFPNGSIMVGDVVHKWTFPKNQFVVIQTNTRLSPYSTHHQYFSSLMPTVVVSEGIHFVWVRHLGALSTDSLSVPLRRYGQGEITLDAELFPYDFASIREAIDSPTSIHVKLKTARAEHGRTDVSAIELCRPQEIDDLSVICERHKCDRGLSGAKPNHQYTVVYDKLFGSIRNDVRHVLEFGVLFGSGLKMWSDYFPSAEIHGLDIKRRQVDYPRVATRKWDAMKPVNTHYRYDIVIDDASHVSSHSRRMFEIHSRLVKPGGFYVIEDLMLHRYGRRFTDESPNMLETCREWVFNPPEGWTCNLYGDQLCILKKDE